MHELGIAAAALQQTLDVTRQQKATRVLRIVLRVGELSGVDPDALRFALACMTSNTPAAGADIEIQREAGKAVCSRCDRRYPLRDPLAPECPECGATPAAIEGGRELELVRLELDSL